MDEREMFDAWLKSQDGGASAFECWIAGRRTTPDREAIIEACAKVCESVAAELLQPGDEEAVAGCVFCRDAIRALKTAPTSDKGGASIKLAHYDAFDDAEKAVQKDVEVLRKLLKGD